MAGLSTTITLSSVSYWLKGFRDRVLLAAAFAAWCVGEKTAAFFQRLKTLWEGCKTRSRIYKMVVRVHSWYWTGY